jgi:DNA-binding protein Alba
VDTVELLRRIFIRDAVVQGIDLGTDILVRDDGNKANVSTIEIMLAPK